MEIRRRPPNPSVKVESLEYAIPHPDSEPRNILEKIVWEKDREIKAARQRVPLDTLKSQISKLPVPLDFIGALSKTSVLPAVIAEIKKASPSKGIIRENFDPIQIAIDYEKGGASCLSILTDKTFFQGGFEVLVEVREKVKLPLLCKDFILMPYQLYQARAAGADAVLLIASILSNQDLIYLFKVASGLGLSVLVEVHNFNELRRIFDIGEFPLIGINNRDLTTFETDLSTTEILVQQFEEEFEKYQPILVSESGLFTRSDLDRVYKAGASAVLVGESLMRSNDISASLHKLIMG